MLEVTQNQTLLKYEVEVQAQGHIELQVPFAAGQKIGKPSGGNEELTFQTSF